MICCSDYITFQENYSQENKVIQPQQSGFRPNYSTISTATAFMDDIVNSLLKSNTVLHSL